MNTSQMKTTKKQPIVIGMQSVLILVITMHGTASGPYAIGKKNMSLLGITLSVL